MRDKNLTQQSRNLCSRFKSYEICYKIELSMFTYSKEAVASYGSDVKLLELRVAASFRTRVNRRICHYSLF